MAKIFFPLGATRARSWNSRTAKYPHYNSVPVDRLSQICEIRGAKHQFLDHHYHDHYLYLKPIIGPAAKLHHASLFVEREILNVDLAGGLINGWRLPLHETMVPQRGLCRQGYLKVTIRAKTISR